jgi:hypothetical protein
MKGGATPTRAIHSTLAEPLEAARAHINPQGLRKKIRECRRFVIVRERLFDIISFPKG